MNKQRLGTWCLLIGLILSLGVGCGKKREISEEQCEAFETVFNQTTSEAARQQQALQAALTQAMAQPLAVSAAACTADWTYRREISLVAADALNEATADHIRTAAAFGESSSYMLDDCPILDSLTYERNMEQLQAAVDGVQTGADMVVVETSRVAPVIEQDTRTYIPGTIQGRAFVFDYATGQIVCAAEVSATNSPEIDVASSSQPRWALDEDLALQIGRAARDNLKAIAP